ncbi:unnamed protein product, partial [Mesorhabditis belari]|uniref:Uncharacterized protein n=1 Tax=Mesorhabditis belari TaxID=2138241 RepID=A0AAF3FN53_9BILA
MLLLLMHKWFSKQALEFIKTPTRATNEQEFFGSSAFVFNAEKDELAAAEEELPEEFSYQQFEESKLKRQPTTVIYTDSLLRASHSSYPLEPEDVLEVELEDDAAFMDQDQEKIAESRKSSGGRDFIESNVDERTLPATVRFCKSLSDVTPYTENRPENIRISRSIACVAAIGHEWHERLNAFELCEQHSYTDSFSLLTNVDFLCRLNFYANRLTEKIADVAGRDLRIHIRTLGNPRARYFNDAGEGYKSSSFSSEASEGPDAREEDRGFTVEAANEEEVPTFGLFSFLSPRKPSHILERPRSALSILSKTDGRQSRKTSIDRSAASRNDDIMGLLRRSSGADSRASTTSPLQLPDHALVGLSLEEKEHIMKVMAAAQRGSPTTSRRSSSAIGHSVIPEMSDLTDAERVHIQSVLEKVEQRQTPYMISVPRRQMTGRTDSAQSGTHLITGRIESQEAIDEGNSLGLTFAPPTIKEPLTNEGVAKETERNAEETPLFVETPDSARFERSFSDRSGETEGASEGTEGPSDEEHEEIDYDRQLAERRAQLHEEQMSMEREREEQATEYDSRESQSDRRSSAMSRQSSAFSIKSVSEIIRSPHVHNWYEEQLSFMKESMADEEAELAEDDVTEGEDNADVQTPTPTQESHEIHPIQEIQDQSSAGLLTGSSFVGSGQGMFGRKSDGGKTQSSGGFGFGKLGALGGLASSAIGKAKAASEQLQAVAKDAVADISQPAPAHRTPSPQPTQPTPSMAGPIPPGMEDLSAAEREQIMAVMRAAEGETTFQPQIPSQSSTSMQPPKQGISRPVSSLSQTSSMRPTTAEIDPLEGLSEEEKAHILKVMGAAEIEQSISPIPPIKQSQNIAPKSPMIPPMDGFEGLSEGEQRKILDVMNQAAMMDSSMASTSFTPSSQPSIRSPQPPQPTIDGLEGLTDAERQKILEVMNMAAMDESMPAPQPVFLQKSPSFTPAPIVEEAFDGLTDEERRRIQEVMNLAAMDESMTSSPFTQSSTLIKTDERLRPVSPSLPLSTIDIQGLENLPDEERRRILALMAEAVADEQIASTSTFESTFIERKIPSKSVENLQGFARDVEMRREYEIEEPIYEEPVYELKQESTDQYQSQEEPRSYEIPDLDLSHLPPAEREQILAVIRMAQGDDPAMATRSTPSTRPTMPEPELLADRLERERINLQQAVTVHPRRVSRENSTIISVSSRESLYETSDSGSFYENLARNSSRSDSMADSGFTTQSGSVQSELGRKEIEYKHQELTRTDSAEQRITTAATELRHGLEEADFTFADDRFKISEPETQQVIEALEDPRWKEMEQTWSSTQRPRMWTTVFETDESEMPDDQFRNSEPSQAVPAQRLPRTRIFYDSAASPLDAVEMDDVYDVFATEEEPNQRVIPEIRQPSGLRELREIAFDSGPIIPPQQSQLQRIGVPEIVIKPSTPVASTVTTPESSPPSSSPVSEVVATRKFAQTTPAQTTAAQTQTQPHTQPIVAPKKPARRIKFSYRNADDSDESEPSSDEEDYPDTVIAAPIAPSKPYDEVEAEREQQEQFGREVLRQIQAFGDSSHLSDLANDEFDVHWTQNGKEQTAVRRVVQTVVTIHSQEPLHHQADLSHQPQIPLNGANIPMPDELSTQMITDPLDIAEVTRRNPFIDSPEEEEVCIDMEDMDLEQVRRFYEGGPGQFAHRPGTVYTIPEDESEGESTTGDAKLHARERARRKAAEVTAAILSMYEQDSREKKIIEKERMGKKTAVTMPTYSSLYSGTTRPIASTVDSLTYSQPSAIVSQGYVVPTYSFSDLPSTSTTVTATPSTSTVQPVFTSTMSSSTVRPIPSTSTSYAWPAPEVSRTTSSTLPKAAVAPTTAVPREQLIPATQPRAKTPEQELLESVYGGTSDSYRLTKFLYDTSIIETSRELTSSLSPSQHLVGSSADAHSPSFLIQDMKPSSVLGNELDQEKTPEDGTPRLKRSPGMLLPNEYPPSTSSQLPSAWLPWNPASIQPNQAESVLAEPHAKMSKLEDQLINTVHPQSAIDATTMPIDSLPFTVENTMQELSSAYNWIKEIEDDACSVGSGQSEMGRRKLPSVPPLQQTTPTTQQTTPAIIRGASTPAPQIGPFGGSMSGSIWPPSHQQFGATPTTAWASTFTSTALSTSTPFGVNNQPSTILPSVLSRPLGPYSSSLLGQQQTQPQHHVSFADQELRSGRTTPLASAFAQQPYLSSSAPPTATSITQFNLFSSNIPTPFAAMQSKTGSIGSQTGSSTVTGLGASTLQSHSFAPSIQPGHPGLSSQPGSAMGSMIDLTSRPQSSCSALSTARTFYDPAILPGAQITASANPKKQTFRPVSSISHHKHRASQQSKIPNTLARVLLKKELKEALTRRRDALEACEIEANQRQYVVHKMLVTGLLPDNREDDVPRVIPCLLPIELISGARVTPRPTATVGTQKDDHLASITQREQQPIQTMHFPSNYYTDLPSTYQKRSVGVQSGDGVALPTRYEYNPQPQHSKLYERTMESFGRLYDQRGIGPAASLSHQISQERLDRQRVKTEGTQTEYPSTSTSTYPVDAMRERKSRWDQDRLNRELRQEMRHDDLLEATKRYFDDYDRQLRQMTAELQLRDTVEREERQRRRHFSDSPRNRNRTSRFTFTDDDPMSREYRKLELMDELARRRDERDADRYYNSLPRIGGYRTGRDLTYRADQPSSSTYNYGSLPRNYERWMMSHDDPIQTDFEQPFGGRSMGAGPAYDRGYSRSMYDISNNDPLIDRYAPNRIPYSQARSTGYLDSTGVERDGLLTMQPQFRRSYGRINDPRDPYGLQRTQEAPPLGQTTAIGQSSMAGDQMISQYANYLSRQFSEAQYAPYQDQLYGGMPGYGMSEYRPNPLAASTLPAPMPLLHQRPLEPQLNDPYHTQSTMPHTYATNPYPGLGTTTLANAGTIGGQGITTMSQQSVYPSTSYVTQQRPVGYGASYGTQNAYVQPGAAQSLNPVYSRSETNYGARPMQTSLDYGNGIGATGTSRNIYTRQQHPTTTTAASLPPKAWHYDGDALSRVYATAGRRTGRNAQAPDVNTMRDLGLRVIGGKRMDNGELGAFVSAVDSSRNAQTLGEVKEGDQVLEWNGVLLTGKTFEEVERIVNSAKGEVELIIKTPCPPGCLQHIDFVDKDRIYEPVPHRDHSPEAAPPVPTHRSMNGNNGNGRMNQLNNNFINDYPPEPQWTQQIGYSAQNKPGQPSQPGQLGHLEVAMHYERATSRLIVRVLSARGLPMRDGHRANPLPNPFVKIYLLPGRKVSHKRRTRFVPSSVDPEWNQLVEYDVPSTALHSHYLEFSLWDYDRFTENNALGQVVVSLAERGVLSSSPRWYPLQPCERTSLARHQINIPVDRSRIPQQGFHYNPISMDIGYPVIS